MKLFIADTAATMAKWVADGIAENLETTSAPLFCPASGDTPASLYREMILRVKDNTLVMEDWSFVGLDEWEGMNGKDEGSCRHYLDRDLFYPLGIREEKICFFDGAAADPAAECHRVERFIADKGRIDVAILGIGINGHVAMNEPGSDPGMRAHVAVLHPATQTTGQKYFHTYQPLTHGLTLGLGNLLEARHIYLLATGEHKAAIVQKALEGPVSAELPASLLRDHPGFYVYLDATAASLLSEKMTEQANH